MMQSPHHFIQHVAIVDRTDPVDALQEFEGFDHGQVPPELGPFDEDDTNLADVLGAFFPRHDAIDFTSTGVGYQDAGYDLDRS